MTIPFAALVRRPPRSYAARYQAHGIAIDPALADRQHAAYTAALQIAGLQLRAIEPNELFADCVFIEDAAVLAPRRALQTRMAAHREGEQLAVVTHLKRTHDIVSLPAGATLDGGDVLHAGEEMTYVGRSSRTNAAGVVAVRDFFAPTGRTVIEIPVDRCLHLKTAATWLGNGTMLAASELVDASLFQADHLLVTAPGEAAAANTMRIRDHLLVLAGYPVTGKLVEEFAQHYGVTVLQLDMSEFQKGDGSLTCLSIIL